MIFLYPQVNKTTQVLSDLININNDRVTGYQAAVNQYGTLDLTVQDALNTIIFDGMCYKQQLVQKVKQLDGETKGKPTISGKIYRAWNDLKVTFACNTQKAIISSSLYNEEIALHAYRAALNKVSAVNDEIGKLLGVQEEGLKRNYAILKSYRGVRHISETPLMYLV